MSDTTAILLFNNISRKMLWDNKSSISSLGILLAFEGGRVGGGGGVKRSEGEGEGGPN